MLRSHCDAARIGTWDARFPPFRALWRITLKNPIRLLLAALVTTGAIAAGLVASPAASAAGTGAVHPGVMTFTAGAQCTANFIFTDATSTYIGQAAHCSGTGASTETDGCLAQSLPNGTAVEVDGASQPGTMVYNSWNAMQAAGETDPDTCAYNDFALIKLAAADAANVDPNIPHWGGPTGLNTTGVPMGQRVYSYGNSSLRFGISQLSPKTGVSLGTTGGGWTHPLYTVTPGIPGDSGSAFLDASGRALGQLSTISIAPLVASNNVSDLSRALTYMRSHGGPNANLVQGTVAFDGSKLPLGV
jgi:hypothetical protein